MKKPALRLSLSNLLNKYFKRTVKNASFLQPVFSFLINFTLCYNLYAIIMKYTVKFTTQFKKDLKLAKKQNKDIDRKV